MRTKPRSHQPSSAPVDDDVKYSLDVLDRVIGEFDDGLLSSAESEAASRRRSRPDLRSVSDAEEKEEKIRPEIRGSRIDFRGSRLSINEQIDDIFSELTEEIYNDDKQFKGEKRRFFDPLPSPPNTRTHPPPVDRKKKPGQEKERMARSQTMDNDNPRSGASLHAKKSFRQQHEEVVLYNSKDRNTSKSERVRAEVHNSSRDSISPPPKPEKHRIHLKNGSEERRPNSRRRNEGEFNSQGRDSRRRGKPLVRNEDKNLSGKEAAMMQELKEKVQDKKGKISKFPSKVGEQDGKRRKERSNSSVQGPVNSPVASLQSNSYESMHNSEEGRRNLRPGRQRSDAQRPEKAQRTESRREDKPDFRRSKSMGPIEMGRGSPERRSRSRGRRWDDNESRPRSQSRGRNLDPRTPESRRGPRDSSSRRSRSRGRSPSRPSEVDRSGKRSREGGGRKGEGRGPPSPEEAQATLEKMLPRFPNGIPPVRQRSMVDLRMNDDFRRNRRSVAGPPWDDLPPQFRNQGQILRNPVARPDLPFIDEQVLFQHQLNIDIQRDLLLRRGFPPSHPLVAGEIPIHPELLGHLHFDVPSRTTLPLGPDDFRRFLPEMQRLGMQSAFPLSTNDLIALQRDAEKISKVKRQKSYKEPSFSSLQHEDFKKRQKQFRSQSTDAREKKFRPFSMFQNGAGWFNPGYVFREGGTESRSKNDKNDKQWYMKEKNLQSLPPVGTMKDSGLGEELHLSREDKNRSSFGMILKDKFQKNPNMYFPDTRPSSKSPAEYRTRRGKGEELSDTDTLVHNMSEGSFDKDSSLSGGRSIGSSKSNRSSGKSSLSHDSINGTPEMKRRTESITTPKTLNNTAVHLPSNPSIILNKKTIRNYTPKESSNMLRQFEDGRQVSMERKGKKKPSQEGSDIQRKSSMDKLIEDFHRNLPPVKDTESISPFSDVDSMFSGSNLDHTHSYTQHSTQKSFKSGTVNSHMSNWSVESSVASFDYHMISDKKSKSTKSKDSAARRRMSQSTTNLPSLNEVEYRSREELSPKTRRNITSTEELRTPPRERHRSSPGRDVDISVSEETKSENKVSKVLSTREGKSSPPKTKSKSSPSQRRKSPPTLGGKSPPAIEGKSPPDQGRKSSPREERIPPEGAASDSPKTFVQRIEVKGDEKISVPTENKPKPGRKSGMDSVKEELKDLLVPDKDGDDDLIMLKKLISEGRISGWNEKPPSFTPPTPPSKTASGAKKAKAPVPSKSSPKTPDIEKTPSGDRPRKNRDAPPPPPVAAKLKPPPETAEIKFLSGRRIQSVENLQDEDEKDWRGDRTGWREREGRKEGRSDQVQRSTSMHAKRDGAIEEDSVAKLIADSTERKFKLNSLFKGIWKKKQYSFDLG